MTMMLQLFGAPVLQLDGAPVSLSRKKAMALLAFLAVTRSRHHRETLAALLWPESDATAAYSALRNVLWILRQAPLADVVRGDRSTVELLDSETLEIDVNGFRDLSFDCPARSHGLNEVCSDCEPQLREAVELWRGPFMSGFSVANSIQFDDWQFAEGEALRRELTETLDRLIEYYVAIEDWAMGAQYARRWLQADALSEVGHRRLMQALFAQGKRSEALQAFDDCARVLEAELGLSPEESTVNLAESIRASNSATHSSRRSRSVGLPLSGNPIIGRREIAARIEHALVEDEAEVVTIVGLGGSGKTTLAVHVGRQIEHLFEDGVVFIPLESITAGEFVASTIAHGLGLLLPRQEESELVDQLVDCLRHRNLLMILDGAEHVLAQVSALLPALTSAPQVRILLTSRTPLGTKLATRIALDGLEYPDADTPQERVGDYAAVRLLRISARRYGHAHESGVDDLTGISRVARLLEGLPLGLEMAADWRSMFSWNEIADRVSANLEFLRHTSKEVAPKHRTLAAVFEQAWGMLPDEAKAVLSRLSVFRDGFTVEAAESVTECHIGDLALLANRCLIKRVGSDRYRIHELLRQFASKKLADASREIKHIGRRHAEFYMHAVARWVQKLAGPEQYPTLERMGLAMGNVRSAFQYASEVAASDLLREACEGLFFYYDMRTQFEEAANVFQSAANAYVRSDNRESDVEAFLWIASGWFVNHAHPDIGAEHIATGLKLLDENPPVSRLHAMANVISAYACRGEDLEVHILRASSSTDFYKDCGDVAGEGLAVAAWATLESHRNLQRAQELAHQSLRLHREAEDAWGEGLVLLALARMAEVQGNLDLALARYEESQRLSEPIASDILGVIDAISSQARVAWKLGQARRSEELAEQALELGRGIGSRLQTGRALLELARARRLLGDRTSAKSLVEEAFALLSHRLWGTLQASCAALLFDLAMDERDIGAAERWLQEVSILDPEDSRLPGSKQRLAELHEECEE
ncbi:BTAD domain-containing putative transcriptional regulator [Candidatus Bipolaricaulota bacterium]